MTPVEGKRVLSVNLGGLGDFITTMPVLSALVKEKCDSLTVIVWPSMKNFTQMVPFITEVIPLPKEKENDPALSHFIREVADIRGFDLVLDFAFLPRAAVITKAAAGRRTIGFGLDYSSYPWYTDIIPNLPDEHRVDRNYGILDKLGICRPEQDDFSIEIPFEAVNRISQLLAQNNIDPEHDRPIALHPGSGVSKRKWPVEKFAELTDRIAAHTEEKVILLGGKQRTYDGMDEVDLAQKVQAAMHHASVNLAGQLSLPELTFILSLCGLFIGNNSGPAHLAATVANTPSLLIWAPRNELIWRPAGDKSLLVYASPNCSASCSLNQCEDMRPCLDLITVDEVFEKYLHHLGSKRAFCTAAGDKR